MSIEISQLPRQTLAGVNSGDLFPVSSVSTSITKSLTIGNLSLYVSRQITGNNYIFPTVDGLATQVLTTDGMGNITWGGTSQPVFESTVPPVNTSSLWYDVNSGRLFVYYQNIWVDASPAAQTGYTGSMGYLGSTGPQGPQGPSGPQGTVGYTGSLGPQGNPGIGGGQGQTGYAGSAGDLGYTGSAGISGLPGGLSGTVQFNDNDVFAATNMSFNINSGQFSVTSASIEPTFDISGTINALGYELSGTPFTVASVVSAPGTANSAGTIGQIAYDATYLYVCVGTNSWVRALASTW